MPGVDDLSGHDRRSRAADARSDGPEGRARLLPRVLARARRPGQSDVPDAQRAEGRRRPDAGLRRSSPRALYGSAIETIVPVSSTRVAEMVKLLENTFRAVNIGLVNELALMCDRMDIDVWEVVDAAKTKPFGFMAFYPGPGPRRPLHPDRSVLPVVEGEAERLRSALHRAGRPHQRRHAAVRRRQGRRGAEHQAQGDQRLEDPDRRRRLQARHRRHARVAGARRDGPAARHAAPTCRMSIRTCRRCTRASGPAASTSRAVDAGRGRFGQYDCIVIVTDHKTFDYDAMVAEADLIVDTRNAIKNRPERLQAGRAAPGRRDGGRWRRADATAQRCRGTWRTRPRSRRGCVSS